MFQAGEIDYCWLSSRLSMRKVLGNPVIDTYSTQDDLVILTDVNTGKITRLPWHDLLKVEEDSKREGSISFESQRLLGMTA
jgi:hypothetical protein